MIYVTEKELQRNFRELVNTINTLGRETGVELKLLNSKIIELEEMIDHLSELIDDLKSKSE